MKKLTKIAAGIIAVAAMAAGAAGFSASAGTLNTDTGTYSSWSWGVNVSNQVYANTTNITNTSRIVASGITVYRDGSGAYVTYVGDNQTGGYGTTCSAKVSRKTYPSDGYNFVCSGCIYNGSHPYSGDAESWDGKFIN